MKRFSEKKVFFKNPSGQKITGVLLTPSGNPPFPGILIMHGFSGYKESPVMKSQADELAKNGFVVLRFDFSNAVGESDGKFENATVTHYLKDAERAVSFLSKVDGVDPERIGASGHSLGGLLCGLLASKGLIRVAVLTGPVSEWSGTEFGAPAIQREWKKNGFLMKHSDSLGRDFRVNYAFNKDALKYSLYKVAGRIKCPVLIIHGTGDEAVPFSESEKLFSKLKGSKKLAAIKDSDHSFKNTRWLARMVEESTAWFSEWLK